MQKKICYFICKLSRLSRNKDCIAKGFATGMAVSFTPFVGFHTLLALAVAQLTRQNRTAALIGTLFGNPWTFPFIWYLDWKTGLMFMPDTQDVSLSNFSVIFKEAFHAFITLDFRIFFNDIWPVYATMLLGCVPYCVFLWGIVSYFMEKVLNKTVTTV